MEILLITGLSGAGKTLALRTLEDIGYFCIDNIPPNLLRKFLDLCVGVPAIEKVAIVSDARVAKGMGRLDSVLDELDEEEIPYTLLYLDSDTETLVRRFKETRRKHHFLTEAGGVLEQAIENEQSLMEPLKKRTDFVINTAGISANVFRERISKRFLKDRNKGMYITLMSFGFKYGVPIDADIVFDVRCLPNPFYVVSLRQKTGLDNAVQEYVMQFPEATNLYEQLEALFLSTLPLYEKEGRAQVVIAIGCTGGKHRSVTFVERFLKSFQKNTDYKVTATHRDIDK